MGSKNGEGVTTQSLADKGGKMNYNYKHIEYILLFKHYWKRVPWFVDMKEVPDGH